MRSRPGKRYRLVYIYEPPRYWSGKVDEREWTHKESAELVAREWPLEHSHTRVEVEEFYVTEWY